MKKIIILGLTNVARILRYEMEKDAEIYTESYCLTSDYMKRYGLPESARFDDRPVVPFEHLNEIYGCGNFQVIIMVGYSNMNSGREELFQKCDKYGYEIGSYISPYARIDYQGKGDCTVRLGRGNIIFEGSRICPFTELGDGNIVIGATIEHNSKVGNFNWFARNFTTAGGVKIGNNNFFGVGASIRDKIIVGNYCLVGVGAGIEHNLEDCTLAQSTKVRAKVTNRSTLSFLLDNEHLFE